MSVYAKHPQLDGEAQQIWQMPGVFNTAQSATDTTQPQGVEKVERVMITQGNGQQPADADAFMFMSDLPEVEDEVLVTFLHAGNSAAPQQGNAYSFGGMSDGVAEPTEELAVLTGIDDWTF